MADSLPLIRPTPRRPFQLGPKSTSAESSTAATPTRERIDLSGPDQESNRTSSFLNLTSSTLFGIYAPPGGEPSTPGGTGTHTPLRGQVGDESRPIMLPKSDAFSRPRLRGKSAPNRSGSRDTLLSLIERGVLLFVSGVGYGLIITHLHDEQRLAPVPVKNVQYNSWSTLASWGIIGVCLGGLLPWIDVFWIETVRNGKESPPLKASPGTPKLSSGGNDEDEKPTNRSKSRLVADWNPVVRGVGAFVGIAFAIRRLPWQSTLQVSLMLALANPLLWYLIDRSKPGFILSTLFGITGTAVLLGINPEMVPMPSSSPHPSPVAGSFDINSKHNKLISIENIGVWTWVASVLFCSSVCFGNIGRRLAKRQSGLKSG